MIDVKIFKIVIVFKLHQNMDVCFIHLIVKHLILTVKNVSHKQKYFVILIPTFIIIITVSRTHQVCATSIFTLILVNKL